MDKNVCNIFIEDKKSLNVDDKSESLFHMLVITHCIDFIPKPSFRYELIMHEFLICFYDYCMAQPVYSPLFKNVT